MNTGIQICFQGPVFSAFGYISRIGIAGSHGNSIFNILRDYYNVFHSSCSILHSHQQCTGVLVFHTLFSTSMLGFFFFLTVAILLDLRWYLIVVLICISSVINDVEHFFMCLLAIRISSLEKWLLKPFAQFLNWTVWFFVVEFSSNLVGFLKIYTIY